MHRIFMILIMIVLCVHNPLSICAKEPMSVIQELMQRTHDLSTSVERVTLEEIAVVTYQVLIDLPVVGVQDSRSELEGIITLKNRLTAHSGMLGRLLAIRMQEAIDCALLEEVNRRAKYRGGETVMPPYNSDSLRDETVTSLLDHNAISEADHIRYIFELNGMFANFCLRKHFTVDDVLTGKAMKAFPSKQKTTFFKILSGFFPRKMNASTMRDFLSGYILYTIDRARDVRILWEVFRKHEDFYLTGTIETKTEKIGKPLAARPYRRRISTGEKNRASKVSRTGSHCVETTSPYHYPILLTFLFRPYFSDVEAIAAQHEGIFSWYNESGAVGLKRHETGIWLELEE